MTDDLIPDFSGDDFADDKNIQEARAIRKEYEKMVSDSLTIIQEKLGIESSSHKNLKVFHMFKSLGPIVNMSFRSSDPYSPLHVSMVVYTSSISAGKLQSSGDDQYLFGHIKLNKPFPKTYVCRETIREKINDLFAGNDLDFKQSKKFSRKFHVLTEDKVRLSELLQFKDLDTLTPFSDMELEFQESACLFRSSRRAISREEAVRFSELTMTLLKLFSF